MQPANAGHSTLLGGLQLGEPREVQGTTPGFEAKKGEAAMKDIGFKEVFDLYVKYMLADAAFWAVITVAAFGLFFAFHVLKRYFESKKGGKE
jgi:hypothetical protein